MKVWRMQDRDGRGPYKPGFSHQWKGEGNLDLPPIYDELGIPPERLRGLIPRGMSAGCACKSLAELAKWFDRAERRRLAKFGYQIVEFEPTMIIAETSTQVLFAHNRPLSELKGVVA